MSNGIDLSKYATPGASSFIPCAVAKYELRRGTGAGVRERLWGDEASEGGIIRAPLGIHRRNTLTGSSSP